MKKLFIFLVIATLFIPSAFAMNYRELSYSFLSNKYKVVNLNPGYTTVIRFPYPIQDIIIGNKMLIAQMKIDGDKLVLMPKDYQGKTNVLVWLSKEFQMSIELNIIEDTEKGDRIVDIHLPDPMVEELAKNQTPVAIQPQPAQPASTTIIYMKEPEPVIIKPLRIDINKTTTQTGMKVSVNYIEENPDGFVINMTVSSVNGKGFVSNMTSISVTDEYNASHKVLKTVNVNYPVFNEPKSWDIFVKGVRPRIITISIPHVSDSSMMVQTTFPGQQ